MTHAKPAGFTEIVRILGDVGALTPRPVAVGNGQDFRIPDWRCWAATIVFALRNQFESEG